MKFPSENIGQLVQQQADIDILDHRIGQQTEADQLMDRFAAAGNFRFNLRKVLTDLTTGFGKLGFIAGLFPDQGGGALDIDQGIVDFLKESRKQLQREGHFIRLAKVLVEQSKRKRVALFDNAVFVREVPDGHAGLLFVDGELIRELAPGLHVFWKFNRGIAVELVDQRVRALEVGGQEILTKDKVALRINLVANFEITDALKATKAAKDPLDFLYKELQFGLRAAVGTRTLDALLEDKGAIDQEVFVHVRDKFAEVGLDVRGVGVKDIILPGDMKEILGKVVEAEKVAQANVIRRREETNATRSLLNTAKVMEDNPTALRLKELETLEKVTDKVGNISVFGGLDGVLDQMVRIKR